MEYRVLGPLEVREGDRSLPLGGAKQRAVLALLLLNANRVVSRDELVDELWGDEPPETAVTSVQVYVSRLRKLLPDRLVTRAPGYLLRVEPDELDLERFETLRAAGRPHEALALWRGSPEADGPRLLELRLATVEERLDADLAAGRQAELIGELEALVVEHPHRERLRGQLMLALYGSGRQAEALEAYRDTRAVLDELGIEPSEALRELEKKILQQDVSLAAPPRMRTTPTNLPVAPTSFVGREREIAEITEQLVDEEARVLTLTGAAGSGKTRLAIEVASRLSSRYRHGIFFVPLEDVRDDALVVPAIANVLGVQAPPNVLATAIAEHLAGREILLVLDNFEQVLAATPSVARLVTASSPFLVTSRAPLKIAAEREYPVPTLTPDEARALFIDRARAVAPSFETSRSVAEICRRLDFLPLAIELAAARVKLLSPDAMLPRLTDRLSLLTAGPRDVPARQQTLRGALDWSYDLLAEDARTLFARLAIFAGGFDVAAAEEVCEAELETLQTLVDSGLIYPRGDRFALLESIREYARERLAADPAADELRLRYARYYASAGERWIETDRAQGYATATLRSLIDEAANLEAAYGVLRESSQRVDELKVVEPLAVSLARVSRKVEALRTLEETLASDDLSAKQRARLEAHAAWMAAECGDHERSRELALVAASDARSTGDHWSELTALSAIALSAAEEGDLEQADAALREAEAVARATFPRRLGGVLNDRSVIAMERGEYAPARQLLAEALEQTRSIPFGVWANLALCSLLEESFDEAEVWLTKGLTQAREVHALFWIFYALHGFAVLHARKDPKRAARLCGALESLGSDLGIELQQLELRLATQTRTDLAGRLGDRFSELVVAGAELDLDDAVALALRP
jgi:predicted ATPase/DNA-binding SARP family transcriptional activator